MDTLDQFDYLYNIMSSSGDVRKMKLFGCVMREMLQHIADHDADKAQAFADKLDTIRWHNYLTREEAEDIIESMDPPAQWSYNQWSQAIEDLGYALQEEPCYNSYAHWVTMNMVYSDSSGTIAKIIDKPLQDIPSDDIVTFCHLLAMDKLKDCDKVFNIRSYFSVC